MLVVLALVFVRVFQSAWQSMRHAFLAGANAALGGVVGKVAFDSEAVLVRRGVAALGLTDVMASALHADAAPIGDILCSLTHRIRQVLPARVAVFALLLFVNASVFRFLARGMDESGSSMRTTVLTSAVNFLASAVLGAILFGEVLSWRWLGGSSLMVAGMYLVATNNHRSNECNDSGRR